MTRVAETVARGMLAPIAAAAVALLVKGYSGAGDGFSAGVVLALGVLLQYAAFGPERARRMLRTGGRRVAAVAVAGWALLLAVVFAPVLWGDPLLTHAPPPGAEVARLGALELHTALLFDIGVFLLTLGFTVSLIDHVAREIDPETP